MNLPAAIAIGFTVLAVPLFLKAACAKPMPQPPEDAWGDVDDPYTYDPDEEERNNYTMQVEDEILRRNGIL